MWRVGEDALAAGKDFNEVAKTLADQAADTVDLGLLRQSELPPELAGPVFDLQLNQPSQPIQSSFGWHILRVTRSSRRRRRPLTRRSPRSARRLPRNRRSTT